MNGGALRVVESSPDGVAAHRDVLGRDSRLYPTLRRRITALRVEEEVIDRVAVRMTSSVAASRSMNMIEIRSGRTAARDNGRRGMRRPIRARGTPAPREPGCGSRSSLPDLLWFIGIAKASRGRGQSPTTRRGYEDSRWCHLHRDSSRRRPLRLGDWRRRPRPGSARGFVPTGYG